MNEQPREQPIVVESIRPASGTSRRWRSVVLGLIILLCGMAIGSGCTLVAVHRILLHAIHNPQEAPEKMTKRLKSKLSLTDQQAQKVRLILIARQKAVQTIRREWQPRVENELERARQEVASELTPEQAKKWNERFDQFRNKWIPALPPES